MARVVLDHVRKVYPGGRIAVDGVSLDMRTGELVVLVGPSGSGKSSLLRLIAGLDSPTSGAIRIGGRAVNGVTPSDRDVAMVFQDHALYPHLSAFDNIAFGIRSRGVPEAEVARRVRHVGEVLDLALDLDRMPQTLSGGQQQRVALGRALVRDPRVFLLDEPLSSIDSVLRRRLQSVVGDVQRSTRATMVYVTHDLEEAIVMGDRVVVLREGRIRQVGPPEALYESPADTFVARATGMNLMSVQVAARLGIPVADIGITDDNAEVGIRPEDVRICEGPENRKYLCHSGEIEVSRISRHGSETLVRLAVAREHILVRAPLNHVPIVGSMVVVEVDLNRVHLFSSETGVSLYRPLSRN